MQSQAHLPAPSNTKKHSQKDDLESLGYLLISLLREGVPEEQEQLCEGLPDEFGTYLDYCRGLALDSKPNYDYLRRLFKELYNRNRFVHDHKFEWSQLNLAEIAPDSEDTDGTCAREEPEDLQTQQSVEIERALLQYETEVERAVSLKTKEIPVALEPEEAEVPAQGKDKGCLIF